MAAGAPGRKNDHFDRMSPIVSLQSSESQSRFPSRSRFGSICEGRCLGAATLPVGQAEVVVELVPREGKTHESRVTEVTIVPGEGYAPGETPSASVVVYDPPPKTSAAPAK